MSGFHHAEERRVRLGLTTDTERRLSFGRSILVIAALSAFSWAILVAIGLAVWSAL